MAKLKTDIVIDNYIALDLDDRIFVRHVMEGVDRVDRMQRIKRDWDANRVRDSEPAKELGERLAEENAAAREGL